MIDGCRPHCASFLCDELGKKAAAKIYVADVMAESKINVAGREAPRPHRRRARSWSRPSPQKAVAEIDRLIADEMMSTL